MKWFDKWQIAKSFDKVFDEKKGIKLACDDVAERLLTSSIPDNTTFIVIGTESQGSMYKVRGLDKLVVIAALEKIKTITEEQINSIEENFEKVWND